MSRTRSNLGVNSIRVGLLEDDADLREIIARWIRQSEDTQLCWDHSNAASALAALAKTQPEVMLVDINLPGMNGIEFVSHAKLLSPPTQFIMVTVYQDVDHIFAALAAGASGYLLKRTSRKELLAAVRDANAGASPMNGHIARKVVEAFRKTPGTVDQLGSLSPRESEILQLLAQGCLYKEIASQLGISAFTVNNFIRRIYEKLHVNSRAQAVAKLTGLQAKHVPLGVSAGV